MFVDSDVTGVVFVSEANARGREIKAIMETNNKLKLSIVIPVYRSEPILPKLVDEIFSEMKRESLENDFELLLVNDASPDESWKVIRQLATEHSFVKGISLRRNFGQHNATMAGLNK